MPIPCSPGFLYMFKKIACKHSTYRLSQSPFFPLYQGDNLRFPVLSKPLLYILTIETTKSSGKNHFPIQTQLRQDSISYSTIFLRISPTIVGFIWVFALFRCEDNFFVSTIEPFSSFFILYEPFLYTGFALFGYV